jgi:long-chain fatty acid transport protein
MSSGLLKRSLIAVTVSGLMASSAAYATNGYFGHGYSTKEKGLAGAGVAHSQDAMAAATNPAGMVNVGDRMDIGVALFNPNRSYTASAAGGGGAFPLVQETVESDNDFFLIPHFAYNVMLDSSSSAGISIYGNGGMNTEYFATPANGNNGTFSGAAFGGGSTAGVDLAQLFFNASYAKKLNDDHTVGASLIFAYQIFKAQGLAAFGALNFSSDPTKLSDNGHDSSSGFGAKIGWQGKVTSDVTLGASYQTKMAMSEFDDYAGLFAEGGDFDIPASLNLGAAWAINDKSTLVVDIQTIYYEDVDAIANSINNFFAAPGPCAAPPNNAGCLGGSAGAGFGWEDMTVIKVGYEWMMDDMTMRVGISQGDQPIPNGETLFNILAPAVMETHITFGLTMPLGTDAEFSVAGMYAPSNDVTGQVPAAFDSSQTVQIEMDQFEVQGTYTMKF